MDPHGPAEPVLDTGRAPLPAEPSPATLLQARHEVVPFFEPMRALELSDLLAWCDGNSRLELRAYTAPGGAGKTRFMIEAIRRLRDQSRQAGFLVDRARMDDLDLGQPTLMVIDDAELRLDTVRTMLDYASKLLTPKRLRIVLLARAVGDWWAALAQNGEMAVCKTVRRAAVQRLAPLPYQSGMRAAFLAHAVSALGRAIGRPLGSPTALPTADLEDHGWASRSSSRSAPSSRSSGLRHRRLRGRPHALTG